MIACRNIKASNCQNANGPDHHRHGDGRSGLALVVFFAMFFGLLAAGRERMLQDPGTFWHVVAGERMMADRAVIRSDPFSFSQAGQTWLAQQWLGECAMAALHRLGGFDLVLLGGVAMLSTLFAWLAARLCRAGVSAPAAALIVALAAGASSYHFLLRPHLASLALMGSVFAVLLEVDAGRWHPRRLMWLPGLVVLWSNVHGAALGGVATIWLVTLGWLAAPHVPIVRRHMTDPAATVWIGAAAALSTVAVLLNPFGSALPATWLGLMRSTVVPQMIIEHGRPDWSSPSGLMTLSLATAYLAMLTRAGQAGLRLTWLLPLVWFVLAASRVRHGPLFAVTAVLAIADMASAVRAASGGLRRATWARWALSRTVDDFWTLRPVPVVAAAAVVLLAAGLKIGGVGVPLVGAGWANVSPAHWPVEAVRAARSASRTINEPARRVFNDLGFGGYLIYFAPELPVYIDDRCELYGDAGLKRYREIVSRPELFAGLAACDDIDMAIIRRGTRLDRHLTQDAGWRRLHTDGVASVYARAAAGKRGGEGRQTP